MKIKAIKKKEKVESVWSKKENMYEIELAIEVPEEDQLYSTKGVYLEVEYLANEKEINRYHFFENETNRHIKLSFKEGEEKMVLEYLEENFTTGKTEKIIVIENNCYPTSNHKRVETKDINDAKTFWYYSDGTETKFEVLTHYEKNINNGGNGRAYDIAKVPKKYESIFQEMKEYFESV